jgi:hypothetical protein
MRIISTNPIIGLPKNSLRSDQENELVAAKKGEPIAIPVGTPNQVRFNTEHNLATLKLSQMTPKSIRFVALMAMSKGKPKPARREYAKEVASRQWRGNNKGREIVLSANMPARYWPESRIARRTAETSLLGRKGKAIRALDVIAQINNGYPEKKG